MSKKQRLDDLEKRVKALENPPRYITLPRPIGMHEIEDSVPLPEKVSFGEEPKMFEGESSVPDVAIVVGVALFLLGVGFALGILWSIL